MTDPTSLTAVVHVRTDTPVEVQAEPHGNWSLTLGNWPAVLSLYGSRDDLRGVLHRALGELARPSSLEEFVADCVSDCIEGA